METESFQKSRERLLEEVSCVFFDTVGDLIPGPAGKPSPRSPESICRKIIFEYYDCVFSSVLNYLFDKETIWIPGIGQLFWNGESLGFLAEKEFSGVVMTGLPSANDKTVRSKLQE